MPPALASFLDRGEPPLVFTLGSSAVFTAGDFYTHAAAAARALGRRAVLLTGIEGRNPLATVPEAHAAGPDDAVVRVEYAPHSELMPRACAVVHQGGVGTTAQALRSGRPMLVVPFSHDQPDNARRCARRGVARVLSRGALGTASLTRELAALLADHAAARTAAEVGARVRAEEGAGGAAEVIESVLAGAR
jgi:UDP:flavonoid glycosyltransferase YjiC (YdhE family)